MPFTGNRTSQENEVFREFWRAEIAEKSADVFEGRFYPCVGFQVWNLTFFKLPRSMATKHVQISLHTA